MGKSQSKNQNVPQPTTGRNTKDSAEAAFLKCEYFLRIVAIFQICLKDALLHILHDPVFGGLPINNQQQTHRLLLAFKNSPKGRRLSRNVLRPEQWDTICHQCTTCQPNCPRAGKTNTYDFDITILCVLLSNYLAGLPAPKNGWGKALAAGDYSEAACSILARQLRNEITGHGSYQKISTKQQFNDYCNQIEMILKGLGYKNMELFEDLKTKSPIPFTQHQLDFLKAEQDEMKDEIENLLILYLQQQIDLDKIKDDQDKIRDNQSKMKADQDKMKNRIDTFESTIDRSRIETTSVAVENTIDNLSENLKEKFQKKYGSINLSLQQRKTTFQPIPKVERNKIVVKLSMISSSDVFGMDEEEMLQIDKTPEETSSSSFDTSWSFDSPLCEGEDNKSQNDIEMDDERSQIDKTLEERSQCSSDSSLFEVENKKSQNDIEMDDEMSNFEGMQREPVTLSSFHYKDIFSSSDDYVLISGLPGCGKTTMVESILYDWSTGELWKEHFDFVFIIYFRQLARFRSDQDITCHKILSHFYPGFDFSKLPHSKTLLIMDGFDEYAGKNDFLKPAETFLPFVQAIYDLIDPNNPKIQFTRLLTSRPGSYPILFKSVFNQTYEQNLRIFKIAGFDEENIKQYVYNHVKDADLSNEFLKKLRNLPALKKFMTIPFFCWGICYLVKNQELMMNKLPVTNTAIYANILTLFIRNHGLRNPNAKLIDLFRDNEFKEMIKMLTNMAWLLYKDGKLTFTSNDLKEFGDIEILLQSGLVIKVESDVEETDYFQFMHYSFQEFLCALYVFYNYKNVTDSYDLKYDLSRNMETMIIGLSGGNIENSSSDVFIRLYASMVNNKNYNYLSLFIEKFKYLTVMDFLDYLYEFQNERTHIYLENVTLDFLSLDHEAGNNKMTHLIKRCENHYLTINNLGIPYSLSSDELYRYVIPSLLTCCNEIECHESTLYELVQDLDFQKIKEDGHIKTLRIRYHDPLRNPSFIIDVIRNIANVKILVETKKLDKMINRLRQIKVLIAEMNDAERPQSVTFYHSKHGIFSIDKQKIDENILLN